MKLLIHKGGGERRIETVCGCVQLKDPNVNTKKKVPIYFPSEMTNIGLKYGIIK
jgi:hypothetical protein